MLESNVYKQHLYLAKNTSHFRVLDAVANKGIWAQNLQLRPEQISVTKVIEAIKGISIFAAVVSFLLGWGFWNCNPVLVRCDQNVIYHEFPSTRYFHTKNCTIPHLAGFIVWQTKIKGISQLINDNGMFL